VAHNQKKNERFVKDYYNDPNGDDYIYPTKKGRDKKIRERKHGKDLIKKGLLAQEEVENNAHHDDNNWYDDRNIIQTNENQQIQDDYYDRLEDERNAHKTHITKEKS
jgi:hypothetical protein